MCPPSHVQDAPTGARSAYIFFSNATRDEIKEEHPEGIAMGDVSIECPCAGPRLQPAQPPASSCVAWSDWTLV